MGLFDSPKYDDPRRWIQQKRSKNRTWDYIRMAGKANASGLQEFLENRVIEDDWPVMSVSDWTGLVDESEEVEESQINIRLVGNDGAIFDRRQDNGLTIPQNERSCWQLYKNSLTWKEESVKELENATIGILRRLSNDTQETGPIKGLVIGHVQSGKTANMEALMAMAADHGWNMFIVLSGTIENLRLQTLRRMQSDLNKEGNLVWIGVEHPSKRSQYGERAQDFKFEPTAIRRYFTVCLKNASRLKKLIDWLHANKAAHDQMRILIIDDEADQASISNNATEYKQAKKERKGINKLIVSLVQDVHYKEERTVGRAKAVNYVMYTATPYANFLNESQEESLYPSNFIWTLKPSDEYIGPNQIYGLNDPDKPDGLDIKRIIEPDDLAKIGNIYDHTSQDLPDSLKDAVYWFICAAAVMRKQGYKKPISMLVHTSQLQSHHDSISKALSQWLNHSMKSQVFLDQCRRVYEFEIHKIPKEKWLEEFSDYGVPKEEILDYPPFDSILAEIKELVSEEMKHIMLNEEGDLKYQKGLHLVIDNCSKNGVTEENEYVRLAYPDPDCVPYPSPAPAFIIVGGSTLSRGLTIEGLVCTYFLRASCQADSLMQMGRWFGYRKKYELLPRIWMTADTIKKYRFLSDLDDDLREDLKKYMFTDVTPMEYGPRIMNTPKVSWIRITSKKHMTNAVPAEMDFSGAKPQTIVFENDVEKQKKNIEITEAFIKKLGTPRKSRSCNGVFWENVSLEMIMNEILIDKFSFSARSRVFNEVGAFCDWIKQVSDEESLKKWVVVVAGTDQVKECSDGVIVDSHHWLVNGYCLRKVNRSRRPPAGDLDTDIDITILRALKDLVADIDVPDDIKITKQEHVDRIRKDAGKDDIPMLLIYRIDKDSKVIKGNGESRIDLNYPCDIIGLQICVPGKQMNNGFCKRLTIRLPDKDEEETVEEIA